MTRAILLKNPVLRNKVDSNVSNPAGDIAREIADQDLNGEAGGTTPVIATATIISVITPTKALGCGVALTVSAECNGGTRCN